MYKKFLGTCLYKIKGLNSERLINDCIKNKINVLLLDKTDKYMFFSCYYYQQKAVKKVLKNYEIINTQYYGLYNVFKLLQKRVAVIVGVALSIILLILWQTHLWQYEITGAQTINKQDIINVLSQNGYGIGCNKNKINTDIISSILLSNFKELAFASVIQVGDCLVINLRENEYDENLDERLITPIVASFNGVINEINTYQGTALVKSGDVVKKGQVLIAPYVDVDGERKSVRARGNVNASVLIKGQVVFNENNTEKVRSGNYVSTKSMELFGTTFPMKSQMVNYDNYEIEKSCKIVCKNMPICFKIVETRYYELIDEPIKRTFEQERDVLIKKSKYLAYENLSADFTVLDEQTDILKAGDNYYITTYLKVETNIGVTDYESNI